MHHIVYKVTNLINGMMYIGKHSTNNLNDGYLGSGKILKQALNKYGRENFSKEILAEFSSSEETLNYEKQIVTSDIVNSDQYYNLISGGAGDARHSNKGRKHSEETKLKIANGNKNKKVSEETRLKMSISAKNKIIKPETTRKRLESRKNYTHSEETKLKISKSNSGAKRSNQSISRMKKAQQRRYAFDKNDPLSLKCKQIKPLSFWVFGESLYELWINNNKPTAKYFKALAIKNNYLDSYPYQYMINKFKEANKNG